MRPMRHLKIARVLLRAPMCGLLIKRNVGKESVQRRLQKGLTNLSCAERLCAVELRTTELRRLRFDLILTYARIRFFRLHQRRQVSGFVLKVDSVTRHHAYI